MADLRVLEQPKWYVIAICFRGLCTSIAGIYLHPYCLVYLLQTRCIYLQTTGDVRIYVWITCSTCSNGQYQSGSCSGTTNTRCVRVRVCISASARVWLCVHVCVCVRARARVCVCVCVCVYVCVALIVCVHSPMCGAACACTCASRCACMCERARARTVRLDVFPCTL